MESVRNGNQLILRKGEPALLQKTDSQQLSIAHEGELSELLGKSLTPSGEVLSLISKALGTSEAEISFKERITITET